MGGCLRMDIRLSQPQFNLKLSCVELRLSLAKVWVKLKHLKSLIKVFEV